MPLAACCGASRRARPTAARGHLECRPISWRASWYRRAGRGPVDPFTALATDRGEVQTRLLEPAISVPLYALTRMHEQPLPAQAMLLDALGEQAARLLQAEHA